MAGGSFGGGTGSELDPYLVEDLADFSQAVNVTDNTNKYFKQVQDISGGSLSISIGYWEGHYNGDWYTMEDISVTGKGFFGDIDSGTIKNMKIHNCTINSEQTGVGTIAGEMRKSGSIIENIICTDCYVYGGGSTGGIVGDVSEGSVLQCYFSGKVEVLPDYWVVGGIVGTSQPFTGRTATISRCGFVGEVIGWGASGGVIGDMNDRVTMHSSYARGTIGPTNEGGGVSAWSVLHVDHCYFAGTVAAIDQWSAIDGISPYGISETSYANFPTESNYRSTTDMQYPYNESNTYINWDFENTWIIDDTNNDMFPYHRWMIQEEEEEVSLPAYAIWVKKAGAWKNISDIWAKRQGRWIKL